MAKIQLNVIMEGIQGAIGKQLVIKQYKYGAVVAKFPDMSKVELSEK